MNKDTTEVVPFSTQVVYGMGLLATLFGATILGIIFAILGIFWFGFIAGFICCGLYIASYISSGGYG